MRPLPLLLLLINGAEAKAQLLAHELHDVDRSEFGWSVAVVGDVDGDGAADFLVGEVPENGANGAVVVYSGATGAVIRTHTSAQPDDYFGFAVGGLGDVDQDGCADYVVGAPHRLVSAALDGMAVVYSGRSGTLLWTAFGAANEQLGWAVGGMGDVSADGRDEILVGRAGSDGFTLFDGDGSVLLAEEERDGNGLGWSVAGVGDLTGDGVADFVVGEPWYDVNGAATFRGRVRIYSGSTLSWIASAEGVSAGDRFGYSVAATGDVDRDGLADFFVGAPFARTNGAGAGAVILCSGVDGHAIWTANGPTAGDWLGFAVAGLADMNGDALPDCIAGAPQFGNGGTGHALALSGRDGGALFDYVGSATANLVFARSVAGGDLNGDGIGDVLLGDDDYSDASGQVGQVQEYLGCPASRLDYGAGWPGTYGIPALDATNDPGFGASLSIALDDSAGHDTMALLWLGLARADVVTSAGGTLLVVPLLTMPLFVPAGGATLTGTIPDDPALAFLVVDLQAIELDAGASHGLSFTRGLELALGFDLP